MSIQGQVDHLAADDGRAPTMGVEEEHFLVHPGSRAVESAGPRVVARAAPVLGDLVSGEYTQCQVEVKTPPCSDGARLRAELARLRAGAAAAAREEGLRLCASGTPVLRNGGPSDIGENPRYQKALGQYRSALEDFEVCALHVHVRVDDRELAVLAANHVRPWLPLLVAMSANSPYCDGRDTGYESWRSMVRGQFPCWGPPPYAGSLEHYRRLATAMQDVDAMPDAAYAYWDLRPHARFPTLEVRAMDVPVDVDDSAALAVLIRALVVTAVDRARGGDPGSQPCSELLRAAYWRAARDGWPGDGVCALTGEIVPSSVQAERLVEDVRPALEAYGDLGRVEDFLRRLATHGTGAQRQRAAAERQPDGGGDGGDGRDSGTRGIVDDLVVRTEAGTEPGAASGTPDRLLRAEVRG
ncbi:glutamate--cysteine ligase [Streptomyces sp. NPDC093546]|uniref:carboxylate-amine ligase n=1 Tax=Streptomyces sp. NPDC093546 TaxID=3366040 RepID=UPI003821C47D